MINRIVQQLRKWIMVLGLWSSLGVVVWSLFLKVSLEGPVLFFIGLVCFGSSIFILKRY